MTDLIPFVVKQLKEQSVEELHALFADGTAYRRIYESVYHTLVNSGDLVRLEDLSREEKTRIWETAKALSKEDRITISKAIYLTEQLLKK